MTVTERLEYLRGELRAERISYGELAELQSLTGSIAPGDVELLEAAGVPEHDDEVGRADFARRADVGERAMALVYSGDSERLRGLQPDADAREEYASDVISDVLTAVFGDPRVEEHTDAAHDLLERAWRSYCGDGEDYDWPVGS